MLAPLKPRQSRRLKLDIRVIARALWREAAAQGQRWALWTPVSFGVGAASYFGLKTEPSLSLALIPAGVLAALALMAHAWGRSRPLAIAAALAAFAAGGFADAKLCTSLAAGPVIRSDIGVVEVQGWVVDVASPSNGRARVLLAPTWIAHVERQNLPVRLRLTLPAGEAPPPGSTLSARAILNPPPGPASPGAYDFARDAWFDRIGGVGLALTAPEPADLPSPAWPLRLEMAVNGFRWMLAQRLAEDLQDLAGRDSGAGLAATVATGHESWLDPADADDLRNSGLAHMLAIAGLHTAAVTGFVFAAIRLAVAAWPWLSLRVPGKKLAAIGGLAAAAAYLTISGAHPPARRAAITASVAFIAILCDRRAISLRSLAIAALLILALQPVAIVEPGFQMSFCATASLVAMAEVWPRRGGAINAPWYLAWPQHLRDWTIAMLAVSFVAGAATSPFAIQHFNRMASYGLFANLLADLLASAVLMPALVIGVLGELVGAPSFLVSPFLFIASLSGRGILMIAHLFATAPGATKTLASAPWPALLLSFVGIIFASLWRGRLRWPAALLGFAVLLWPRPPPPAGWIAADGNNAAITVDGRAIVLKPTVRKFASQAWAGRRGLVQPFAPDAEAELAFDCDRSHCVPRYGASPALGAWWSRRKPSADKLDALCRASDILILRAAIPVPPSCSGALVLTSSAFAQGGAAEIFPTARGGWRVDWSEPERGVRPWTQTAEGEVSGSGG